MSVTVTGETDRIRDLLASSRVRLGVHAADWRDAVRAAGELMVRTETVEARYVDAMIAACERFGPYIVIAPGLALPHSRSDDGVLHDSLALIVLDEPVEFGNAANDPVHVVLALSAASPDGHLDQLRMVSQSLARLAAAGDDWLPLRTATSAEDAIHILCDDEEVDR